MKYHVLFVIMLYINIAKMLSSMKDTIQAWAHQKCAGLDDQSLWDLEGFPDPSLWQDCLKPMLKNLQVMLYHLEWKISCWFGKWWDQHGKLTHISDFSQTLYMHSMCWDVKPHQFISNFSFYSPSLSATGQTSAQYTVWKLSSSGKLNEE